MPKFAIIGVMKTKRTSVLVAVAALCVGVASAAYEIGEDLSRETFWRSDPVLFVRQHVDEGFQFTSSHCLLYMKPLGK